jgi:hypothetical protein
MSSKSRLRVAVLCDGPRICGLGHEIITELQADARIEFPLVVRTVSPGKPDRPVLARLGGLWREAAWRCANKIDRLVSNPFRRRNVAYVGHDVDAGHPLAALLPDAHHTEVRRLGAQESTAPGFDPGDIAAIRSHDLDVILCFGARPPAGGIPAASRHGVWYFRYTANPATEGQPPGFWEWYDGAGDTVAALEALGGEPEERIVIAEASYRTFLPSGNENLRRVRDASSMLMLDALRHLADHGAPPKAPESLHEPGRPRPAPGPGVCVAAVLKSLWRTAAFFTERYATQPQWRLLVHEGPLGSVPLSQFHEFTPPRDRFWADPFLLTEDGRHFIFFEDFLYSEQRGLISMIEHKDGEIRDYREIIDVPYHLSFPFIFRHEGRIYMLPESHKNNTIELWACKAFPHEWEKSHVLMDGVQAVDTVLFENDGRWWMFTRLRRARQANISEIHIFYSNHPLSTDWRAHPLNPVVRNARVARMAGRVFRDSDGRIIRCAQDNRFRYGSGIVFCEVTKLTPEAYEERIVDEIRPDWDRRVLGAHHFDSDGQFTVIDANFQGSRFRL